MWLVWQSLCGPDRMLTQLAVLLLLLLLLLQASLADHRVPDYVAEDPLIKVMGVTREQVVEALQSVGFSEDLLVRRLGFISISIYIHHHYIHFHYYYYGYHHQ
jgi:hypothetical protein